MERSEAAATTTASTTGSESLVDLLGEPRATIVRLLKEEGEHSAPELAERLGITDVAVRRHLALLHGGELITERTVKQERGRPVARYRLTERGERLFPHRYAEMVGDLFTWITDEQGRSGVRSFLRWRQERDAELYASHVDAPELPGRLEQLAEALCGAGFAADVRETEDGFELRQTHCAVYDTAKAFPEICTHEAAVFREVLGEDVRLSRRRTLATGADACVCQVQPKSTTTTTTKTSKTQQAQ